MFMERFGDQTYAVMRIMAGLLFFFHGTQKLFEFPAKAGMDIPVFITYSAGPIELVGGALIALGLFTRWAAFLCSGLMAAAYWMAHGTQGFWPILNQGELAILFCFAFLMISSKGAGIWSVDDARASS